MSDYIVACRGETYYIGSLKDCKKYISKIKNQYPNHYTLDIYKKIKNHKLYK